MLHGHVLGCIDVTHRNEAQPCRLATLSSREFLVNQARDRMAVERRRCILGFAGLDVAEGPAEQSAIELLGGSQIRSYQFSKDDFADVMFLAGGLNQRRQRRCCGVWTA